MGAFIIHKSELNKLLSDDPRALPAMKPDSDSELEMQDSCLGRSGYILSPSLFHYFYCLTEGLRPHVMSSIKRTIKVYKDLHEFQQSKEKEDSVNESTLMIHSHSSLIDTQNIVSKI